MLSVFCESLVADEDLLFDRPEIRLKGPMIAPAGLLEVVGQES